MGSDQATLQRDDDGDCIQQKYFRGFGQAIQVQTTTGDVEEGRATVLMHGLNDLTIAEVAPQQELSLLSEHRDF